MSHLISATELETALSGLEGWRDEDDALVKDFIFPGFREAVAAMVRISFEADEINHHPEMTNVYSRLTLRLCTHNAGDKITDKDLRLAALIEKALGTENQAGE